MVAITESDNGTKRAAMAALIRLKRDIDDGRDFRTELDIVWQKIKRDAEAMCPKGDDSGLLASTIRVTKVPMGRIVGNWSRIKDITLFDRSIIAGDITKTTKSGRPCDYAAWVHDGHKMKDGRMYAGIPFLTQALAQNEQELNKAIERALKKLGAKFSQI